MKTVEQLTNDCKEGRHQTLNTTGYHGCAGRGIANDPTTKMGNYAGERVRIYCTCACHTPFRP